MKRIHDPIPHIVPNSDLNWRIQPFEDRDCPPFHGDHMAEKVIITNNRDNKRDNKEGNW